MSPPRESYDWHKSPIVDNFFKIAQVIIVPAVGWFYLQMYELTIAQRTLAVEVQHVVDKVSELRAETVRKDVQAEIDRRQDRALNFIRESEEKQNVTVDKNGG